jgi:hypothetical protein
VERLEGGRGGMRENYRNSGEEKNRAWRAENREGLTAGHRDFSPHPAVVEGSIPNLNRN